MRWKIYAYFLHKHCICGLLLKPSQIHPLSSTPLQNLIHHVKSRDNVWGIEYLSKWFHLSFHFGSVEYLLTGSRFLISCCSTYNCSINAVAILTLSLLLKSGCIFPSSDLFLKYSFITFIFHFERNQRSREQSTRREQLGENVWGANYLHIPSSFVYSFLQVKEKSWSKAAYSIPSTPNL